MAAGDIGSFIDTLEFDTTQGKFPYITHVSGNVYAIAYCGTDYDGYLKTVTIHDNGQIDNSPIDTLVFDSGSGTQPCIIRAHASGDVFAIAYKANSPNQHGWLRTVTIHPNGQIDNSVIDTLVFESSMCADPSMIHISGNVCAIAYMGSGGHGLLKTVTIQSNGQIDNSPIDTFDYDGHSYHQILIHVSGNIYAIAYQGPGAGNDDGRVATVTINDNGQIDEPVEDSFMFCDFTYETFILKITNNVVAVVYEGTANKGFLKTFSIDASGNISLIDTLKFEDGASGCTFPHIINVGEEIYAISYRIKVGNRIDIRTVAIHDNGQIDDSPIDYKTVTTQGNTPRMIRIAKDMCAIVLAGVAYNENDGYVKTIGIEEGAIKGGSSALLIFAEML